MASPPTQSPAAKATTETPLKPYKRPESSYDSQIESMRNQFLNLADSTVRDDRWTLVATQNEPWTEVYKLKTADFCFKVLCDLQCTAETAFDMLSDITRRGEWDQLCEESGILETVNSAVKVQFMKTKGIWPAAPRDTLVVALLEQQPDGRYLNVSQSIEHPDMPPRDAEGIVRMEAKIAGQIVGPCPNGDPNMCRVVQVADGDLKGWIPKSVLSYIAEKSVPASFKSINSILSQYEQKTTSDAIKSLTSGASSEGSNSSVSGSVPKLNGEISRPASATRALSRRQPPKSMMEKVRNALNWCSPYFITILFILKIIRQFRPRPTIYLLPQAI